MTPHYDWTPASEPPHNTRTVLAWSFYGTFSLAFYSPGIGWRFWTSGLSANDVITHWRDVEGPEAKP